MNWNFLITPKWVQGLFYFLIKDSSQDLFLIILKEFLIKFLLCSTLKLIFENRLGWRTLNNIKGVNIGKMKLILSRINLLIMLFKMNIDVIFEFLL
jgi:hypothetical protein